MSDPFETGFNSEKTEAAYMICVAGSTVLGAAVGSLTANPLGTLGGAAVGLAIGLAACPHLKEPIRDKLFGTQARLSDAELVFALKAIRSETGVQSRPDALYLLAIARQAYPRRTSVQPLSHRTRECAALLLKERPPLTAA